MAGADLDGLETAERVTRGVPAGGILVARREALLEAPLDSRFVGWGQEDMAIGIAMRALFGRPWEPRRPTPLVHLWHPPQERLTRKWGSLEGRSLVRRYERARRDPDQMRRLLEEIPCP